MKVVDLVYVYMIRCSNDTLYTGVTNNFPFRWKQHENGTGSRYIKANGYKEPVFLKSFDTRSEAMIEERRIKKMSKGAKEKMIKSNYNLLNFLYYLDIVG